MLAVIFVIYQVVITILDFIHLMIASLVYMCQTTWRIFDPPKMKNLNAEIILVSGTANGIGKELALQLARQGATIVCLDIDEPNNMTTVDKIRKEGGTAHGYVCDVSKSQAVHDITQVILRDVGEVSILINNAACIQTKRMTEYEPKDVQTLFEVNVFSHFWTIFEWLPRMIENKKGHIVSISSLAGEVGIPYLVPYSATKFAVNGMMDALAEELRFRNRNPYIKVTNILPCLIEPSSGPDKIIRFPSITKSISSEKCAELIVESVRREDTTATIPGRYFYMLKVLRFLPRKIQNAVMDFLNSAVDEGARQK